MGRGEGSCNLAVVVEMIPGEEEQMLTRRKEEEDEGWELRSQLQELRQLKDESKKRVGQRVSI